MVRKKDEDFNAEQLRQAKQVWRRQERRVEKSRDAMAEREAKIERTGLPIFGKSDMSDKLDAANRERMREYNRTVGKAVSHIKSELKKNVDSIKTQADTEIESINASQERRSGHEVDRTNRVLARVNRETNAKLKKLKDATDAALKKAKTPAEVKRIQDHLTSEANKLVGAGKSKVTSEERRLQARLNTIANQAKKDARSAAVKAKKEAKKVSTAAAKKTKQARQDAKKKK